MATASGAGRATAGARCWETCATVAIARDAIPYAKSPWEGAQNARIIGAVRIAGGRVASNGRAAVRFGRDAVNTRGESRMAMGRAWVCAGAALAAVSFAADVGAQRSPFAPPQGFPHVAAVVNVRDAVNVVHVQKLQQRVPQKCGARQVAPGVWVKIDCHGYKPVPNAKPLVFSAGRARMIQ